MEKVGRYEIVGELGRGAMGVVYRAIDPNIGRTVALKTMLLDLDHIDREQLLCRFRNEAHAAGQMSHPNIVTVHDADQSGGLFYIAMEYLEGETLQSLMAEKRIISTDQIVEIAKQVAAGLDYAHSMKVVHRDIKPANIMITRQHVAKIMDFGISKSVGTLTRTGQVFGTPYYMSPEQVMGHVLDGRSDLFSFGVVLYEMATGARPFGGDTVATVIYKIIHEIPSPASDLQTAVHPALSAIITRCLEKKGEDRYQSGAELAGDLEKLISLQHGDRPTTVSASPTPERTQPIAFEQVTSAITTRPTSTRGADAIAPPALAPGQSGTGMVGAQRFRAKKAVIWTSVALLVLLAFAAIYRAHQHRQAQSDGGYSVTVIVPAKVARRARHEVAEKRELQRVRETDRPASSPSSSSIPENAQTAQPQRTVAIHFTSNPEGASIRLDGESNPEWVTPYTIADIVLGTHRVEITKAGYSPEIRDVEIGPRDRFYEVDMVPQ